MSAPTISELDQLAGRALPTVPGTRTGAGTGETLDELCERFESLCANAVDALELAAGLESDGMSDQTARVRYGYPDVFSLAEEMYRRTLRDPAEPAPAENPWHSPVGRHLLHGLLFGLPALCFPVAGPLMAGRGPLVVLVAAMLTAWSASQGLSYLGHARRSRLDGPGSRRVLRVGLPIGVAGLTAVVLPAGLFLHLGWPVLVFAIGQGGYLLGATVLLVCGADWWLAGALAPGVLVSTMYLLAGQPAWSRSLTWWAVELSLALTIGFAVYRTTWPRPKPMSGPFRAAELRAAGPTAVFGLLVAGLLTFPLLVAKFLPGQRLDTGALLGALPLSLSMGIAEWRLYAFRGRIDRLMRRTDRLAEFSVGARLVLSAVLAEYVLSAGALAVAVAALARLLGIDLRWTDGPAFLGYLALGSALFLALLLQVCIGALPVLGWCAGALAAEAALVFFTPYAPVLRVQLVVAAGMAVALLWHAAITLGRVSRHAA
ncbi:MAG TPA: hypothetical protein VG756_14375 [Pseudonocardiaceae bacterium]|jgi:hypothetical protein|nr:hypothetical protein [Pseudonocardiaceae bacterium]